MMVSKTESQHFSLIYALYPWEKYKIIMLEETKGSCPSIDNKKKWNS